VSEVSPETISFAWWLWWGLAVFTISIAVLAAVAILEVLRQDRDDDPKNHR
jgi:hypothetical protein